MQVDDDELPYPDEGPFWSDEEAAELLRDFHAAFDGVETPPPERLVVALRNHRDDIESVVRIVGGRRWSELTAADLMRLYDFPYFVSDEGFPVMVAALVHQALVAPGGPEGFRFELEDRLMFVLNPNRFSGKHTGAASETIRRIRGLSHAQLRMLRRFMDLTQRQNPRWAETEGGRFWASLPAEEP
jgi:hypothetical protein